MVVAAALVEVVVVVAVAALVEGAVLVTHLRVLPHLLAHPLEHHMRMKTTMHPPRTLVATTTIYIEGGG